MFQAADSKHGNKITNKCNHTELPTTSPTTTSMATATGPTTNKPQQHQQEAKMPYDDKKHISSASSFQNHAPFRQAGQAAVKHLGLIRDTRLGLQLQTDLVGLPPVIHMAHSQSREHESGRGFFGCLAWLYRGWQDDRIAGSQSVTASCSPQIEQMNTFACVYIK